MALPDVSEAVTVEADTDLMAFSEVMTDSEVTPAPEKQYVAIPPKKKRGKKFVAKEYDIKAEAKNAWANAEAARAEAAAEEEGDEEISAGEQNMRTAEAAISGIMNGDKESMEAATDSVKDAMMKIPYLKEVMLGAEFAKIAFMFAKKNAPPGAKREIGAAFNEVVGSRLELLKQQMWEFWSGQSGINGVIGDYFDYLSLINPADTETHTLDLLEYYEATRSWNDHGNWDDYKLVQTALQNDKPSRSEYLSQRQKARGGSLDEKNDTVGKKIKVIMARLADDPSAKSPFHVSLSNHSFV